MNLEIELKNEADAICEFNENKISENLDHYLLSSLEHKPIKEKLTITIRGTKNSKLKSIIHDYYKEKYYFIKKVDTLDNIIRLILFLMGILFILISKHFHYLLDEIFLIAGWVTIWEIVYDILFNEIKRKRDAHIYKVLANCDIIFKDEKRES